MRPPPRRGGRPANRCLDETRSDCNDEVQISIAEGSITFWRCRSGRRRWRRCRRGRRARSATSSSDTPGSRGPPVPAAVAAGCAWRGAGRRTGWWRSRECGASGRRRSSGIAGPSGGCTAGSGWRTGCGRSRGAARWRPSGACGPGDERDDLQGRLGARVRRSRVVRLADQQPREPGPARRAGREIQAAARLQLHEHQPDRSGDARADDCRRGQRRHDHEEVRRQDDRHRAERPRRWAGLQLQRAQAEHRHHAERAGQGDHRHRSHVPRCISTPAPPSRRATRPTRRWRPSTRAM